VGKGEGRTGRDDQVARRRLDWPGFLNARDLGGLPLSPEGETRFRALIRSDLPAQLSRVDLRILEEYGVRTVIDLRTPRELSESANPLRRLTGYRHLPLLSDRDLDHIVEAEEFPGSYLWKVDNCGDAIGAILTGIATAPSGGVLFHCLAGKDRTGVVAALLLVLAGVGRDAIVDDYMLSDGPAAELRPTPAAILGLLDHVDRRHGGVPGYLASIGVTPTTQSSLGERLTRPRPASG
jgi:hypothetical protein